MLGSIDKVGCKNNHLIGEARIMAQKEIDAKKKVYVLDTNVLVHDPYAIYNFGDAIVGIPAVVLEQLDKFKREGSPRGRTTRDVIRLLDSLRDRGCLGKGVSLDGGTLRVFFLDERMPPTFPFKIRMEDNEILFTAVSLKHKGYDVVFVSKDLNARVKADTLGIPSQDYIKEDVSEDRFYKGWVRVRVSAVQLKKEFPEELKHVLEEPGLELNEFVLLESQHNPFNYRVFRYLGGTTFKPVYDPLIKWPLKARNPQQLMALDLLFDTSVQLVSLIGPAGTGKTFLALLAGLHQVLLDDEYQRLLVSRPVVPLGRDIGYLPGTLEEKLRSWMLPIYDNLDFIMHATRVGQHFEEVQAEMRGRRVKKKKEKEKRKPSFPSLDELILQGKLSLEAITYMRGRSIPYQYILIDEVQNLTSHEVKTLVSRVGVGSKMILTGDPYQIDSPYLDFSSNGLVVAAERFKGQYLFGSVYLETSERSALSQLAGELL